MIKTIIIFLFLSNFIKEITNTYFKIKELTINIKRMKNIPLISEYSEALNFSIDNHDYQLQKGIVLFGPQKSGKTAIAMQLIGRVLSYQQCKQNVQNIKTLGPQARENQKCPATYVGHQSTLIVDGIQIKNRQGTNQQQAQIIFNQRLFLNHLIRKFEDNLKIVIVLEYQKIQTDYVYGTLNGFLKFWNFREQSKQSDIKAIISNLSIIISRYCGTGHKLNFILETLQNSSKCDEDLLYFISNLRIFSQQAYKNRVILSKKITKGSQQKQLKQKEVRIIDQIIPNKMSNTMTNKILPIARTPPTKTEATIKICSLYFEKAINNFEKVRQIVRILFDLATKQQKFMKSQKDKQLIQQKISEIDNQIICDSVHRFSCEDISFLRSEGYVTYFRKLKFQDFQNFTTMKKFILSVALVLQGQQNNRFYKILQVILDCSLTVIVQSEGLLEAQLLEKCRQKHLNSCKDLLIAINQVVDLCIQDNDYIGDQDNTDRTYSGREYHNHWFRKLNNAQKQKQLEKALAIIKQLSRFNQSSDECPQSLVAASIDISVLLNRAQAIVEAIQCLLVTKSYNEAILIISQKASTCPQITRKYLNKLFSRFLDENQFQFAQKCLDILSNKNSNIDEMGKIRQLYSYLYQRKQQIEKSIINQNTRILYQFAVLEKNAMEKIKDYLEKIN